MSYELLIEDLNITLISNSVNISNYNNDLITINNTLGSIQNNIDILITKLRELRLEKQIENLRIDICGLEPNLVLSKDIPNFNVGLDASNNILRMLHRCKNTSFNYNTLALTNDFSLKFENMNKVFRVKYNDSNNNISNIIFYIYGFENEVIDVVKSNVENVTRYIANVYENDISLNDSNDIVNFIIKEDDNYKLLLIDGTNKRILSSININILGDNPMNIPLGTNYIEPGATATNNLGELLNVIITNNINTNIVGTYNVVYKVTDISGNDAENIRIVNVI